MWEPWEDPNGKNLDTFDRCGVGPHIGAPHPSSEQGPFPLDRSGNGGGVAAILRSTALVMRASAAEQLNEGRRIGSTVAKGLELAVELIH